MKKIILLLTILKPLMALAGPMESLIKKGYSKTAKDLKYCGEDYNGAVSIWTVSEKDRLLLCVSPDQSVKEAQKQKTLQLGRNVLPLMSEFVLIAKNKATSICSNDEVREVDCAAFISEKKIEVMITHKKMPGLQSVSLIECVDDKCEKKKGCSSQIPISKDFREHKLKSFLKRISDDAKGLAANKPPQLKDYTIDEQIVLVRLALKEDNVEAEQILNWFTLGKNCKDDCISADDFFEDRECRKK
ncbi:hypothetical protein K2X05_12925 [bacterium]|nr:hypothetical protein [bacterium]